MTKETILAVCPGRGTYNAPELGYLARHHPKSSWLARFDALRAEADKETLSGLDGAAKFTPAHLHGHNAAPLIHACAFLDFLSLDRERFDVVAVTGNSMGWYTALACAGAVAPESGFAIADGMGLHSKRHLPGGQTVLALAGDDWLVDSAIRRAVLDIVARHGVQPSILLGGMLVVAGDEQALAALEADLDFLPRKPLRLAGHGPFHTPLMQESSDRACAAFPLAWFGKPDVPMIDGRGKVWRRFESTAQGLRDYTFTHQILEPYDFSAAITVGIREFAPDRIVLLGPGETLGGAIGQVLVSLKWQDITSRKAFAERQDRDPFLISMDRPGQRGIVTA